MNIKQLYRKYCPRRWCCLCGKTTYFSNYCKRCKNILKGYKYEHKTTKDSM